MKRKAQVIRYSEDGKRALCVDTENWETIYEYIQRDKKRKKKFNYIATIILEGHVNRDVYDKEDINRNTKDVTAMKLFKGGTNDRIYCKELTTDNGTFVVIAAELFEKKKDQKVKQKHKNLIEKVANYNYEIIP